jgi:exopolysaccharide biosynthesis protein
VPAFGPPVAFAADAVCAPATKEISPGVVYEQVCRMSPEGQPWSIHILRVSRKAQISIRAVASRNQLGEMSRELPTAMAKQERERGRKVLAVTNGDFDFTRPESHMGVSLGLSVIDGRIWTGDESNRPVLAFTKKGEPVIGIPALHIEARVGQKRIPVFAINKPMGGGESRWMFTGQFRSRVPVSGSFRSLVATPVSHAGPLPLHKTITVRLAETQNGVSEVHVPSGGLVIVNPSGDRSDLSRAKAGDRIKIQIDASVEGKQIRDAIGGFPILVRNGNRSMEGEIADGLRQRHPRTAVCYNRDSVIFTVVDGRQPSLNVGMTLEELADLMVGLGCDVAMNTDGGGSSVMAIQNETGSLAIVNSPSDGKERGRGNLWLVEGN